VQDDLRLPALAIQHKVRFPGCLSLCFPAVVEQINGL